MPVPIWSSQSRELTITLDAGSVPWRPVRGRGRACDGDGHAGMGVEINPGWLDGAAYAVSAAED